MTAIITSRLALLGLALALAPAAQARDNSWYIGLRGGVVLPSDRRFYNAAPTGSDFITHEKLGWAAAARLGYDFGMLRTEVDVGYHQNNMDSVQLLTTSRQGAQGVYNDARGQMRYWTAMGNALIDIVNTDAFSVSVGAGAGTARVNANAVRLTDAGPLILQDHAWVFAWNALAGARVAMGPNVDLAVDYRFLRPNRARFNDTAGQAVDTRKSSHTILVGLNFNFGGKRVVATAPEAAAPVMAPEPAPPPPAPLPPPPAPPMAEPPPPPPPGPVMLFFDFDSSDLKADAQQLIAEAANPARQNGPTMLSVNGYTDRAGTAPYNMALGQRRAEAVRRELESKGISRDRITIQSFGEDRSLVATADGQREPQNRRVEIIVQPR